MYLLGRVWMYGGAYLNTLFTLIIPEKDLKHTFNSIKETVSFYSSCPQSEKCISKKATSPPSSTTKNSVTQNYSLARSLSGIWHQT